MQHENELLTLQTRLNQLEESNKWLTRQFKESSTEQQKVNTKLFGMLRGILEECPPRSAKADKKAEHSHDKRFAGSDSKEDPPVN
jgi:hypothetical protein